MSQPKSNEGFLERALEMKKFLEDQGVEAIHLDSVAGRLAVLIQKKLAQKDAEVAEAVKKENKRVRLLIVEYFEKGLGFNKGSINDSIFQDLKDGLLKTTTPKE